MSGMLTKTETVKETVTKTTYVIDEATLCEALGLPEDTLLQFHVPGGGDHSNCALTLEDRLVATVIRIEREETAS